MEKGKLLIISGFSGVGKGTIVEKMLEAFDNYKISISCTILDLQRKTEFIITS